MKRSTKWIIAAAAAAVVVAVTVIVLVVSGVFRKDPDDDKKKRTEQDKFLLAAAAYPEFKSNPKMPELEHDEDYYYEHEEELDKLYELYEAYEEQAEAYAEELVELRKDLEAYGQDKAVGAVADFTQASMQVLLSDRNGANRVYSPINIYLMLGMLSEITDGNCRQQLLDLAKADSVEDLRERSKALWNSLYQSNGDSKCVLASSFWLSDDLEGSYNKKTLDILAKEHRASAFSGQMGSEEYNDELHKWINSQTGNLLEEAAGNLKFDRDTVAALVTTILYEAKWDEVFYEERTAPDTFHAKSGDVTADFMHEKQFGRYYYGDNFKAVFKDLNYDYAGSLGTMWFILPEEGTGVDALLSDPQLKQLISELEGYENAGTATINFAVPKFDISYDTSIIDPLRKMGVTDLFDPGKADFSPLMDDDSLFVDQAEHAARLMIDEDGVKAAAFTFVSVSKSAKPEETEVLDFKLDRPFLFVLCSDTGIPLFAGVVENPLLP
ncbi:MAG: hypothetical protein IKI01_03890 [Lachnospiraceae bacterium]|nr:hypothetical protein [Lachnospiraceae bacterium]